MPIHAATIGFTTVCPATTRSGGPAAYPSWMNHAPVRKATASPPSETHSITGRPVVTSLTSTATSPYAMPAPTESARARTAPTVKVAATTHTSTPATTSWPACSATFGETWVGTASPAVMDTNATMPAVATSTATASRPDSRRARHTAMIGMASAFSGATTETGASDSATTCRTAHARSTRNPWTQRRDRTSWSAEVSFRSPVSRTPACCHIAPSALHPAASTAHRIATPTTWPMLRRHCYGSLHE